MADFLIAVAGGILIASAVVILARLASQLFDGFARRWKRNHEHSDLRDESFEEDVPLWR